jgi:hypothetical protein
VRIICEDNLDEDLVKYRAIYVAFAPPETIPAKARAGLESLTKKLPSIIETSATSRPALEWKLP